MQTLPAYSYQLHTKRRRLRQSRNMNTILVHACEDLIYFQYGVRRENDFGVAPLSLMTFESIAKLAGFIS